MRAPPLTPCSCAHGTRHTHCALHSPQVTKDQQTWRAEYKGPEGEASAAPVAKAAPKPSAVKAAAAAASGKAQGTPKVEFQQAGNKWVVEHQGKVSGLRCWWCRCRCFLPSLLLLLVVVCCCSGVLLVVLSAAPRCQRCGLWRSMWTLASGGAASAR
jgi:hypothetical protein